MSSESSVDGCSPYNRPSTSLSCRSEDLALPSSPTGNKYQKFNLPKLKLDDNPQVYEHEIDRNSGLASVRKPSVCERKVKKYGQNPPVDKIKNEKMVQDSILAAQMLQSAVQRELAGREPLCHFNYDSDIGCKHCIRSDLRAEPGRLLAGCSTMQWTASLKGYVSLLMGNHESSPRGREGFHVSH